MLATRAGDAAERQSGASSAPDTARADPRHMVRVMRARVMSAGATLDVASSPGAATHINYYAHQY
jgi:hypothetical protein